MLVVILIGGIVLILVLMDGGIGEEISQHFEYHSFIHPKPQTLSFFLRFFVPLRRFYITTVIYVSIFIAARMPRPLCRNAAGMPHLL